MHTLTSRQDDILPGFPHFLSIKTVDSLSKRRVTPRPTKSSGGTSPIDIKNQPPTKCERLICITSYEVIIPISGTLSTISCLEIGTNLSKPEFYVIQLQAVCHCTSP